jgi:hypothetical protein
MNSKVPKVRHRILKELGNNLYLCTDARAGDIPAFEITEGGSGGGGFKYLGYMNPNDAVLKVDKNTARMLRKASCINNAKKEERRTGTCQ